MPKPIGKHRRDRRIDHLPANAFGAAGAESDAGGDQLAPPVPPTIPAPTITSLTEAAEQNAVTPSRSLTVVWTNLETIGSETYRVQVATDSGFTAIVGTWATAPNQSSTTIGGFAILTTYYVRVATIVGNTSSAWSASANVTTLNDTTAPGVPTGAASTFAGIGDLVITWTNATSQNLKDVEIKIWESSSKITLYGTFFDRSQYFVWSAAANLATTAGVGDPTLYTELRSRSYGNVFSSAVVVGTATKAIPATPTVTLVQGATQVIVASISSARGVDVARYEFVFKRDGSTVSTKLTTDNFSMYEMSGAGDGGSHSWTVVARAQDGLNQYSSSSSASGAIVIDLMTIEYLRQGLLFTDSVGNTQATLDALKDAITGSGGVSYAA